jgi:hypothetical protein
VNRVVKIIAGVKALIVVASAVALILEAFIAGETHKIEKDTDALVKIETQIKDLLAMAKPSPSPN